MWEQVDTDQLDWSIGQQGTPNNGTGPWEDHTLGSVAGHYAFLSSIRAEATSVAGIKSPIFTRGESCLRFWYLMYGLDVQSLKIFKEDSSYILWEINGNQGLFWKEASLYVNDLTYFTIQAETGLGPRGDIAIDDISFDTGYCYHAPYVCDFDHGTCGFTNEEDDTGDWRLARASDGGFGPGIDHTYHSGAGRYFTSNCSSDNSYARLNSRSYPKDTNCISFWYQFGQSDRSTTLNVYKRPGEGTEVENPPLVTINYIKDSTWMLWNLNNIASTTSFQLVFDVECASAMSSVSLDDIVVLDECSSFNCDFEGDCPWTNFDADNIDWITAMGELTHQHGPETDHTVGNSEGKYLFLENGFNSNETMTGLYISPLTYK